MLTEILLFIVGIVVSTFGTLIGFGGGVFMVPILIILFQFPIELAIGTAMTALLPAALVSSFFNFREKSIDYVVASLLQFPAMVGTVIGAFLVAYTPVLQMQILFSVFVLAVGVYMLGTYKQEQKRQRGMMYRLNRMPTSFIRKNHPKHLAYRLNGGLMALFGLCTGTMAGLFGIGGGFLQTPIMIRAFRIPSQIAISTSLFILVITSLSGISSHYWLGHINWDKSLPLMLAFAIGALLGKAVRSRNNATQQSSERLIGIGLVLAGMSVMVHIFLKYDF
ncbi:sulfite exporter TauE/SafE family protein [Rufibacter immobilis]|uniref:Probable membrane transporter protein n=1 Tax=Rufibacter immobilis TaxID=1348778 RepID=A0A3M9MWH9_9BACT|nr:sulfite exporter TauE/SafE family protein [Rufibacter immobilis]RNI29876.1 sulfite exporter TauE/SafE family protein [Rufibacter immobilis]